MNWQKYSQNKPDLANDYLALSPNGYFVLHWSARSNNLNHVWDGMNITHWCEIVPPKEK